MLKDLEHFKLFILPIFYLIHGEAYDSTDPASIRSYDIQITHKQVNIFCKKCKSAGHCSLIMEWLPLKSDTKNPRDITSHHRGAIFHGLHYEDQHPIFGMLLYNKAKYEKEIETDLIVSNDIPMIQHSDIEFL